MVDPSIITIQNLNHFYGEGALHRQVLFDINLDIKSGEFVIMTGPSGSGKSTLLSLMGCLRTVQFGSLKVLGQELKGANESKRKAVRRQFGYIFQTSNLVEFLTAERNLYLSLELHADQTKSQIRRKTQSILEAVQLGECGQRYPNQLSGGQRQRIAIACALVTQPKLLLADEPTAALDSQSGRAIVELMRDLAKAQGSAVLMVTHDPRILDVADRIIRVEDGKLGLDYRQEIALALPGLKEQDLESLEFEPILETFQPGQYIIRQGESAEHFYMVISGALEVVLDVQSTSQASDETGSRILKTLKRGDYFGEIGLLQGGKRTASVRAKTEVTVMVMTRAVFLSLMKQSESTEMIMAQRVQQRILLDRLTAALPGIKTQDIVEILPSLKVLRYGPGSIVIREGDLADLFYVVVDGFLEIIKPIKEDPEMIVRQLEPGDYFGEIGLFKQIRRTATVRVCSTESAELIALDRSIFQKILERSEDLKSQMTEMLGQNIEDQLACLLYQRFKDELAQPTHQSSK